MRMVSKGQIAPRVRLGGIQQGWSRLDQKIKPHKVRLGNELLEKLVKRNQLQFAFLDVL